MANRLLILQPSYYRSKSDRTVVTIRRRQVMPLTLPCPAALTRASLAFWFIDISQRRTDHAGPANHNFDGC